MPKIDYILRYDQGTMDSTHDLWRVSVVDSKNPSRSLLKIGEAIINNGFGQSKPDAIKDFLSRNKSNVIEKIFDLKEAGSED